MNVQGFFMAACLMAGATPLSVYAGEHGPRPSRVNHDRTSYMREVSVAAKAGEFGHGWHYYADAHQSRAVVINPNGDYYYSHGEGLKLVFKAN